MNVQQIERTSKRYKGAELVGVGLIAVGMAGCAFAASPWGFVPFFAGVAVWAVARMAGWWHHG